MCFTVNVNLIKEELEKRYGSTFLDPDKYRPSYYYHAYALPELPAICSDDPDRIKLLKWGLIPSWVNDYDSAQEIRYKTFNARAESIDKKPSFSKSFSTRRCIVPVRGFYEWQHRGAIKVPWFIARADDDIMSLAGLWSEWVETVTGEVSGTFTIITTDANDKMAEIHNSKKRMPVIIEPGSEAEWLNLNTPVEEIFSLMKPYPSDIIKAYTISNLISRKDADRNSPEIIRPFSWDSGTLF